MTATEPSASALQSGWRHLVIAWVIAFLLPGLLTFGIQSHFREREKQRQQEEQTRRALEQIQSMNPEDMSESMRMLLGLDPVPKAGPNGVKQPLNAGEDTELSQIQE